MDMYLVVVIICVAMFLLGVPMVLLTVYLKAQFKDAIQAQLGISTVSKKTKDEIHPKVDAYDTVVLTTGSIKTFGETESFVAHRTGMFSNDYYMVRDLDSLGLNDMNSCFNTLDETRTNCVIEECLDSQCKNADNFKSFVEMANASFKASVDVSETDRTSLIDTLSCIDLHNYALRTPFFVKKDAGFTDAAFYVLASKRKNKGMFEFLTSDSLLDSSKPDLEIYPIPITRSLITYEIFSRSITMYNYFQKDSNKKVYFQLDSNDVNDITWLKERGISSLPQAFINRFIQEHNTTPLNIRQVENQYELLANMISTETNKIKRRKC